MKLSERNVLVGTGIVFILLFVVVKFWHDRPIDKKLDVTITDSAYETDEGILTLQLENPIQQFDEYYVQIVDEHDNAIDGTSTQVEGKVIFNYVIPELNIKRPLKVKVEEISTNKEKMIHYQIPEEKIDAS